MKVGLFFGSFNPVHIGHMIIANHMVNNTELDMLWMVVSPHNPHKQKKSLAKDYDRLHLLNLAIDDHLIIKASDVEFKLAKPSYTIDTMTYLEEKYPQHEFSLIMGGDNLASFHKWKNFELLLKKYPIYVYKRPSYDLPDYADHENIHIEEAPLLDISASFIRKQIKLKKSIKYLVPDKVYDYLQANPIYDRL
jgi:nicotinate-nucleotide adenylyltransferase